MTRPTQKPRLILLADRRKPKAVAALGDLLPWLEQRALVVARPDPAALTPARVKRLPRADLAIVFGGDGTLLAQARLLVDRDIPLLGVNFGKLGFLAGFDVDRLKRAWPDLIAGRCRVGRRLVLDIRLYDTGPDAPWQCEGKSRCVFQALALNDAVITAGAPFRMIELELAIDPRPTGSGTTFSCDGVIVSTPSGSTAYSLSAGGPIISPNVEALSITPICPHSLAFRPIVVGSDSLLFLRALIANRGTTLVIDGQVPVTLKAGQQVAIRKHRKPLLLVDHPEMDYWQTLAHKLHWAARPRSG